MKFADLVEVDATVNRFEYKTDPMRYGSLEHWSRIDATGGDCEDYALEKVHRLHQFGWDIKLLRLCYCKTETGEGHGVLLVDFLKPGDSGIRTWVLDNRQPAPSDFQDLVGYTFISAQEEGGSRVWREFS